MELGCIWMVSSCKSSLIKMTLSLLVMTETDWNHCVLKWRAECATLSRRLLNKCHTNAFLCIHGEEELMVVFPDSAAGQDQPCILRMMAGEVSSKMPPATCDIFHSASCLGISGVPLQTFTKQSIWMGEEEGSSTCLPSLLFSSYGEGRSQQESLRYQWSLFKEAGNSGRPGFPIIWRSSFTNEGI